MSHITRIFLLLLMLVGLVAFVAAPKAQTVSPKTMIVADGSAPMPTCLPSDPNCSGPITK
jgi:hypothetical protein